MIVNIVCDDFNDSNTNKNDKALVDPIIFPVVYIGKNSPPKSNYGYNINIT